MARHQGGLSDDTYSRRDSGHQRRPYRGRGRGRGRYSKRGDYDSRRGHRSSYDYSDTRSRSRYADYEERENHHDENADVQNTESHHEEHHDEVMDEHYLYDDRPLHDDSAPADTVPLEQRISMPERGMEQYGDNVAPVEPMDVQSGADEMAHSQNHHTSGEVPPSYSPEGRRSGEQTARDEGRESGVSSKDPEELRQKVLESLEQKKKKAAVFMSKELEGAGDPEISRKSSTGNAENPERDAAVDALLATFKDTTNDAKAEDNQVYDSGARRGSGAAPSVTAQESEHHGTERYEGGSGRGDRGRYREYSRRDDPYADSRGRGRHEARSEYRHPDYDRKGGVRDDPYWRDRPDGGRYPTRDMKIKGKANEAAEAERTRTVESRYALPEDDRRPVRRDDYYARDRGQYGSAKHGRYADPVPSEAEYGPAGRDYPPYPPQARSASGLDDPRYPVPPTSRPPPERDYAASYYRDLSEWLEITGYHDLPYRQMQLQRHRDMYGYDSRRYGHPDEAGYPPPPSARDDPGYGRARGSSAYDMPPPPAPTGSWDERDGGKHRGRSAGRPPSRGNAYPPGPADRRYSVGDPAERNSLKRRISLHDGEYGEPPHLAKSARHAYDDPYHPRAGGQTDMLDGADSARMSLSRRIARAREPSPGLRGERRGRSLSPVPRGDFAEDPRGRFENETYGRGKPPGGRGRARDEYRDSYRRPSFDGPPNDRGSYGRGRGRGSFKDFNRYDRPPRRDFPGDQMSDAGRYAGYAGGERDLGYPREEPRSRSHGRPDTRNSSTRYFVIKSFNEENVKMSQEDNIWATQQKNAEILEQAFHEAQDVILFFSINKSGKFQGYARMEGAPGSAPPPAWSKDLHWESSKPFKIKWLCITDVSFHLVSHLRNLMNEGQAVLIGRDGQEIDPECGAQLMSTIDAQHRKEHPDAA